MRRRCTVHADALDTCALLHAPGLEVRTGAPEFCFAVGLPGAPAALSRTARSLIVEMFCLLPVHGFCWGTDKLATTFFGRAICIDVVSNMSAAWGSAYEVRSSLNQPA